MELLRAFDLNEGARRHSEAAWGWPSSPAHPDSAFPSLVPCPAPFMQESLYRHIISFLFGICLGVERLNHTVGEY